MLFSPVFSRREDPHDFCAIAPTPAVAYGARTRNGGCMITASHNPEEYNGLKLFNCNGSSYSRKQQAEVEDLVGNSRSGVTGNPRAHYPLPKHSVPILTRFVRRGIFPKD